jgi:2-polyprenyl-6-methoxyphenol hydroxylase-like FAD-dependent oxidoreductase
MQVVVVGGGVSGLATALAVGRAGHAITVVERDDTPMPASADEAFEWDRRGAPQVRHSHAFLARLRNLLLDRFPDVHARLLAAGATEMRFGDNLPPTMEGFERLPGDDELTMIAARRTTFEWVLRHAVLDQQGVTIRTGAAVTGLSGAGGRATGVVLDDRTRIEADLVVIAGGRRASIDEWSTAIGGRPTREEVGDTGIVYLSRFYRLGQGEVPPPRSGLIGGDLGYLKWGVFVGDNRTFSVTLAIPSDDGELRRRLTDPATFDCTARSLAAAADWLDGRSVPITPDVHVMGGLLNRWRDLVVDDEPVVGGVAMVGDAVVCTNPLYGRGCSTGFWSGVLLADSLTEHGDDLDGAVLGHAAALREHLRPWYRSTVVQDTEAQRVAAALLAGDDPDGDVTDPRTFMRAVFRQGLAPAMRTDPVVLRAVVRQLNLLVPPDSLTQDAEVAARVLRYYEERDSRPPEPVLGPPDRAALIAMLEAA